MDDDADAADLAHDDVPPPAYRPAARAPEPQFDPRGHADVEPEAAYVAHKPAPSGKPTPEALARLRAAIQKDAPRPAAAAPRAEAAPQPEAPAARPRFGINSLINKMTGHSDDGHAAPQAERRQPPMSGGGALYRPAQQPARMAEDDGIVDPEQERIEIPAFLRRQAN
jgi:cell division protein FtsZ